MAAPKKPKMAPAPKAAKVKQVAMSRPSSSVIRDSFPGIPRPRKAPNGKRGATRKFAS